MTVAAALAFALIYFVVTDGNGGRRGETVQMQLPAPDAEAPVCDEARHLCIVNTTSGFPRALYMFDTHPASRIEGCEVRWLPDLDFADPESGESSQGWFRSDCSGTLYSLNGERVFGPGARNLDQFPILLTENGVDVFTGRLICGASVLEEDCEFAPESS